MITTTNFQMFREFNKEYDNMPHEFGVLSGREIDLFDRIFQVEERTVLDLRNLRDFIVAVLTGDRSDDESDMMRKDKMSAMVCCVDRIISKRGYEV